ncbi:iron complex transport system substrate-binding protein [Mesocricetibacter intestinalis]|uniref:Iron complex transport system substrate-binding protein n=1 Tax=Mesocricetibacter intestinalis TaxID=1521930 RepID=A0A4R6VC76_9PAST|nr:siderophore ABC transporter substrate-binding protein [Mesocricetibacter intestinalis]TDQ59847.1 iron complex transport system substrate-binding protein [Mesocricetibacter intestinalis]
MKKTFSSLITGLIATFCLLSAQAGEIQVENFAGRQSVPQNPKRVVVLDFGALDSIRELGAKDSVIALAKGRIPEYLSEFAQDKYKNAGTLPEPDFEAINALEPDLIIASARQQKVLNRLKEIAPVFYIDNDFSDYYRSFAANVRALGQIFAKEDIARQKLAELDTLVEGLQAQTKGKNALVTLVNESRISAFGDNSRYALVYQKFGFTPIDPGLSASTHGNSIGFEYIAEKNPDYLLVIDRTAAITEKANNAQKVLDNALIKQTEAAKQNHIVYLNASNWYLAFGGLQSMKIMVDELQSAVKK